MFRWMFRKYLNRNPASVKDNGRAGKRGGRQNRTSMVGAKTKFKTQENVKLTKIIVQAYSVEMPPNSAAQNCQFWRQFHQLLYSSSDMTQLRVIQRTFWDISGLTKLLAQTIYSVSSPLAMRLNAASMTLLTQSLGDPALFHD